MTDSALKIHTAETLDAMTPAERIALFDELGREAYGTTRWHTAFARDSGWTRRTFYNWTHKPEQLPVAAVLLLQEWARRRTTPEILLAAVNKVANDLGNVASEMKGAARMVAQTLNEERAAASQRRTEQLTAPAPAAAEPEPVDDDPGFDVSRL